MANELKLCPFCLGEATLTEKLTYGGGKLYGVSCLTPMCPGSTPQWCLDAESAIEVWNARDGESVDREALLELANELESKVQYLCSWQTSQELRACDIKVIVHRIREALGVTE